MVDNYRPLHIDGASMEGPMKIYVAYQNPLDYPGEFVLREHRPTGNGIELGDIIARGKTFDEMVDAAQYVIEFLHWMPRFPGDDPVILGTWF